MTYRNWERVFLRALKPLKREERERALEYYEEMRDEKLASGEDEEAIVAEFGSPESCARAVMGMIENQARSDEKEGNPSDVEGENAGLARRERKKISPAEIVGLLFFGLLIVLPLFAVIFSVVASFAAVTVSAAAVSVAGVVFAAAAPFIASTATNGFAYFGMGLASAGLGALLFVGFLYATKYTAIGAKALFQAIYVRR